ncbi:MAG: hypothetical protein IPG59_12670 [Candidatus Melainabacteria bacterium]|nr:MAG: hypothetical protein IPG59_12670 [Candidatus Melainabacteria bacterium]
MAMVSLTVVCWLVTIGLFMAIMSKMTKFSIYKHLRTLETKLELPGFWAPEYIIIFLGLPAGVSLCTALLATAKLGNLLSLR